MAARTARGGRVRETAGLCLAMAAASCGAAGTGAVPSPAPAASASAPGAVASLGLGGDPSSEAAATASPRALPSLAPLGTPGSAGCTDLDAIATWSPARRAAQLVVVPAQETDVAAVAPSVEGGAGGVILFGAWAPPGLGASLRTLSSAAPGRIAPVVMTDEEGGGVQRMADLAGSLPWPATMAATMSPTQVRQLAAAAARRMVAEGVRMDLAPVLDLAAGPGPDALHTDGPRAWGLWSQTVTEYGLAFAEGLEEGGVTPVVKHFPGEGSATANTDYRIASTPPLSRLEAADLLPFEAAVRGGLPAVMVGNASVPGLTELPASLSPAVISGLLRGRLGFTGLVLTDSLSAAAVSARGISAPQAAVEAVAAGADMVLFTSSQPNRMFQEVVAALVAAVSAGRIPVQQLDASVARVLAVKGIDLCQ
jgi:beta-N-acetylhexosaminidase